MNTTHRSYRTRWLSLSLLAVMLASTPAAMAAGADVKSATAEQKKTASGRYGIGMEAFDAGQHEAALAAFQGSYDTVASPNSLLMVARTLVQLGRSSEAHAAYRQTIAQGEALGKGEKKYADTAKTARTELAELEQKSVVVTLDVRDGGLIEQVTVNGKDHPRAQWAEPLLLAPGSAEVIVLGTSGGKASQKLEGAAGQKVTIVLAPPPAPAAAPTAKATTTPAPVAPPADGFNSKPYMTGALVVGAAGLVTSGVFAYLSYAEQKKIDDNCVNKICKGDYFDSPEKQANYATFSRVGLGVGLVGLTTAGVLWAVSPRSAPKEEATWKRPQVAIGPTGFLVQGQF